jgi:RND superfamily putative drug exporter
VTRRPFFTERLARRTARHPVVTLAVWAAVAVGCAAAYLAWGDVLTTTDDFLTTPEAKQVEQLVAERLPGAAADTEVVVVTAPADQAGDAQALKRRVAELAAEIAAVGPADVASVRSAADEKGAGALVSKDGRSALILVTLAGAASDAEDHVAEVYDLVRDADGDGGFSVAMTGSATWRLEARQRAESDLRRAELIAVPIAVVILLLVFGAVAAAVIPLALAVVAILVAMALTAVTGEWFDVSVFAVNMVTVIGLAVGIDYSLLIVSRFREERRAGCDVGGAIGRAGATASRAVFFSGGIVVFALCGLLIVPYTIFTSLGVGAMFVVVAAVAAALTLLPALFRVLGDRVDWGRLRFIKHRANGDGEPDGFWTRAARVMMRSPLVALVLGCGVLIVLALPVFGMRTGMTGVDEFPNDTSAKQAYKALRRDFSVGLGSPILVTIEGDLTDERSKALLENVDKIAAADDRFTVVGYEAAPEGDLVVVKLAVNADATSGAAMDAVRYLRDEVAPLAESMAPVQALVGGVPALYTDAIDLIESFTPWVIGVVLGLSFLLLLVAFRSLVIAAQAIVMNLLSVGASYGLVTLVFQDGVGAELLGFTQVERILAWLPLLMFCVLFGLSMDYHIFLLSRIRERYDATGDTSGAVIFGVGSTGGIITGAAAIMVAVFAGMAMGDLSIFQQLGFGLALAVAIDATIVRTVIVPAAMTLTGRWCWYLPRWLEWLPKVRVDEGEADVGSGTAASVKPMRKPAQEAARP